ncbi:hypothetical protein AM571_CH03858 [Rhizobium etli 8C-3]|uniref:Uncharacterized protein n=1 Tax=Rhizobium etli 8C-3 TaxID=538025 RepID=A0A1L5P954_RHIET|nr:hypothetical protein AM571_CH03858 [Rhizobium etli 8C-3]
MTNLSVCIASTATFNHRSSRRQAQLLSVFNLIDSRYREVAGKGNQPFPIEVYADFSWLSGHAGRFDASWH